MGAYSALAMTVGLVLIRPRIGLPRVHSGFRVGPATAAGVGVVLMSILGLLTVRDVSDAAVTLVRPFITIVSIMITTTVAQHTGVLDRLAAMIEARAGGPPSRLLARFFALGAATAAILNNDAAILLLTPVIVPLIRRRYPNAPRLILPFAFAVFLSAGVAPMFVSNPMNLILAEYAGISFNDYLRIMLPISIVGWFVTFLILRLVFHRELSAAGEATTPPREVKGLNLVQIQTLILLMTVLFAYPVVCFYEAPIWPVALLGALLALYVAGRDDRETRRIVVRAVPWEILIFLLGVSLIATGLKAAGVVERLSGLYAGASVMRVGWIAAIGSALLNNHPMSLINMMALEESSGAAPADVLAALIGGDLGPRLLPIGSLAGLLWIDCLKKQSITVSLAKFVGLGVLTTVPVLAISLFVLSCTDTSPEAGPRRGAPAASSTSSTAQPKGGPTTTAAEVAIEEAMKRALLRHADMAATANRDHTDRLIVHELTPAGGVEHPPDPNRGPGDHRPDLENPAFAMLYLRGVKLKVPLSGLDRVSLDSEEGLTRVTLGYGPAAVLLEDSTHGGAAQSLAEKLFPIGAEGWRPAWADVRAAAPEHLGKKGLTPQEVTAALDDFEQRRLAKWEGLFAESFPKGPVLVRMVMMASMKDAESVTGAYETYRRTRLLAIKSELVRLLGGPQDTLPEVVGRAPMFGLKRGQIGRDAEVRAMIFGQGQAILRVTITGSQVKGAPKDFVLTAASFVEQPVVRPITRAGPLVAAIDEWLSKPGKKTRTDSVRRALGRISAFNLSPERDKLGALLDALSQVDPKLEGPRRAELEAKLASWPPPAGETPEQGGGADILDDVGEKRRGPPPGKGRTGPLPAAEVRSKVPD